jgi:hypothetical protein
MIRILRLIEQAEKFVCQCSDGKARVLAKRNAPQLRTAGELEIILENNPELFQVLS